MTVGLSQQYVINLPSWLSSANHPTLENREVHVWRASLASHPEILERCRRMLSENETVSADRFHFEIDSQHFVIARGWLRTLLGRYLEIDPATVCCEYEEFGKPRISRLIHNGCQL